MKRSFLNMSCIVMLAGLLAGCEDSGKPQRKQLPKFVEDQSWEGQQGYQGRYEPADQSATTISVLFSYRDTVLNRESFIKLSLQNPAVDSMAFALLNMYEPMAGAAMSHLLQKGKSGVVLDFRSNGEEKCESAGFVTRNMFGQQLSLLFLWDKTSAARATIFMDRLPAIPGIRAIRQQP